MRWLYRVKCEKLMTHWKNFYGLYDRKIYLIIKTKRKLHLTNNRSEEIKYISLIAFILVNVISNRHDLKPQIGRDIQPHAPISR